MKLRELFFKHSFRVNYFLNQKRIALILQCLVPVEEKKEEKNLLHFLWFRLMKSQILVDFYSQTKKKCSINLLRWTICARTFWCLKDNKLLDYKKLFYTSKIVLIREIENNSFEIPYFKTLNFGFYLSFLWIFIWR